MYSYNICYSSWEDGMTICLTHEKKFSKDELNLMIAEIALKITKKIIEEDTQYNLADGSMENESFSSTLFSHTYANNNVGYSYIEEKLIEDYGFNRMEFAECWHCEGWAHLIDPKSWSHCQTPENKFVTKYLNDHGFKPKEKPKDG